MWLAQREGEGGRLSGEEARGLVGAGRGVADTTWGLVGPRGLRLLLGGPSGAISGM